MEWLQAIIVNIIFFHHIPCFGIVVILYLHSGHIFNFRAYQKKIAYLWQVAVAGLCW